MHISIRLLTIGAALAASPALAQVQAGGAADVGVGAGATIDGGGLLGGVTGTLDRSVGALDRGVNGVLGAKLRLATRADLAAGAEVRDRGGRRVGTVQEVHGDMALVVQGGNAVHVPLAALYRGSQGLVTSLTSAQLRAGASAQVEAHGSAHAH